MKGSEKFWYAVFTLCLFQSLYWIFTLKFFGCDPRYTFKCFEEWFFGYEWYQKIITSVTMIFWLIFIAMDAAESSNNIKESKRELRWFNPFYYINKLADKFLTD